MAVTMQAVSGAGYPGVPSLDILGNASYIAKEEEKMEEERQSCWHAERSHIDPAPFAMSAQCISGPVEDAIWNPLQSASSRRRRRGDYLGVDHLSRRTPRTKPCKCAAQPILYITAPDRPQPRLDCDLAMQ